MCPLDFVRKYPFKSKPENVLKNMKLPQNSSQKKNSTLNQKYLQIPEIPKFEKKSNISNFNEN